MTLLEEIVHCPNVKDCFDGKDSPCSTIIKSQKATGLNDFQLPEPWNGHIETSKLLFISSNPSYNRDERNPTSGWSNEDIAGFFTNNLSNGTNRKGWSKFWLSIRKRAEELYGLEVMPGKDYSLFEVVRCKSTDEVGVAEAKSQCIAKHLDKTIAISPAKIIIGLGDHAIAALREKYDLTHSGKYGLYDSKSIGGHTRMFIMLPHPNARMLRKISDHLTKEEVEKVKTYLLS